MAAALLVNNGSECYGQWSCNSVGGPTYTPTSLEYQIWNTSNNTIIVGPISLPLAPSGQFVISSTVNTISGSGATENRLVVVKTGIPGGSFRNDVISYTLVNQPGTP